MSTDSSTVRRRKAGAYLMAFFMVGWCLTMISLQFYTAYKLGYGSGFGDGFRLPPELAAKYGSGTFASVQAAVAATSHNAPEMSVAEDIGRLLYSLAVLSGIIYFWYFVMSRVGTF